MWFRNQCSNSKPNGRGVKRDPSSGHRPRLLSSPCMWSAFCLGTKTISKELWLFFLKNKVSVKFDEVKDFVAALKNLLAIQGQEVRSEGNSLSRAVWPFPLTVYLCVLWFLSESGRLFCNHGNSLRPRLKLGLPTQAPSVWSFSNSTASRNLDCKPCENWLRAGLGCPLSTKTQRNEVLVSAFCRVGFISHSSVCALKV